MSPGCPFHNVSGPAPRAAAAATKPFSVDDELGFLAEVYAKHPEKLGPRREQCRVALGAGRAAPPTTHELTAAARIAWRNHSRCIGRLYWRSLEVRDRRGIVRSDTMFEALAEHLARADNGGQIRSVMTVFAPRDAGTPAPRIWNHQLCGYAGYRDRNGHVRGDPRSVALTEQALALGWEPPKARGAFDLLPWIIQGAGETPRVFALPPGLVREVPLSHPELPWFGQLGLRWYAVPVIADMCFHAAGTDFPAAPFNGWYMGTEIGARNLADEKRYNQLPVIAARMGLDTRQPRSLWQDRALVELNLAVLHSFAAAGVRIVDHHTASREFTRFCAHEKRAGRSVSARWDWIVPPLSPATTEVFHTPMHETANTPDFHYERHPL